MLLKSTKKEAKFPTRENWRSLDRIENYDSKKVFGNLYVLGGTLAPNINLTKNFVNESKDYQHSPLNRTKAALTDKKRTTISSEMRSLYKLQDFQFD